MQGTYKWKRISFDWNARKASLLNPQLFNQANLKLGITGSTAIQLVVQSFIKEKELTGDELERSHGFGDITLRVEQNLLGNDKGSFAIAMLPNIKFPTASGKENNSYEGGLIVPMSLNLVLNGNWACRWKWTGYRMIREKASYPAAGIIYRKPPDREKAGCNR